MADGDRRVHGDANRARSATGYRPELQGLRALAVVLVVVYHVWINRVSGGVDVFFVVSGFLLTGQLVRAAESGGIDLWRRWSRTLLRLTPTAAVVLAATALAGALVLPEARWVQTVREIAAAALFLENWQLAADSADYAARNNMASVVQHFWSLSIQGQFFVLWPLLIAVVAIACRGSAELLRQRTTLMLLGLAAASLTYSIELTIANQPLAYFHTLTRLWEFALGGLLALHIDRIVLTLRSRIVAGWTGVVGLIACGIALPVTSVFPGFAALWPTGCAALVLLAGHTGSPAAADRWLAGRPARYVGDISYALYLWHWPVLVLFLVASGQETPGPAAGALIIVCSAALATLTHHVVEQPLLRRPTSTRAGYRYAAVGTTIVLLLAGSWQLVGFQRAQTTADMGDPTHPGARALLTGAVEPAPLLPPPVTVLEDWVRIERWDCTPMAAFPMDMCTRPLASPMDEPPADEPTHDYRPDEYGADEYGADDQSPDQPSEDVPAADGSAPADHAADGAAPPVEPAPPARRIVVVGDSHAQQLIGALIPLAERNHWQLTAIVRGACPFSTASEVVPDEPDCLAWNAAAADEIAALRPDAVVTLASRDVRPGLTEQTPAGFVEQWRRLDAQGIPVLALRDNPRFGHSVPDCVQRHSEDVAVCGANRADVYAPTPPWVEIPDLPGNVAFVDIADAVCDADLCPPVIGNVLVYLDDNHLTATYSNSMADLIADQVQAGLGW
jgi:peptidoglycan/LPS O-acetylase OafA/YrhL